MVAKLTTDRVTYWARRIVWLRKHGLGDYVVGIVNDHGAQRVKVRRPEGVLPRPDSRAALEVMTRVAPDGKYPVRIRSERDAKGRKMLVADLEGKW